MVNKCILKETYVNEIEVEKSKFYGIIFPVESKAQFENILEKIKKDYPKATHYCYAYIIENDKKASDNGEPSGTAGKPILNILETHNLNKTGLVVVRYFGGTLLGAGRLTRTYSLAANEVFKIAHLYKAVQKTKVRVSLEIDVYDKFLNYLNKMHYIVIKTVFNDKITMDFLAEKVFDKSSLNFFLNKVMVVGEIPYEYAEELR